MSSMPTDGGRPLRLVRGGVVGLVGGLLAVGGHAAGGGAVPGPAAWVGVALVVVGALLASSRRWTPARLVLALVGAQALVHGALWLASPAVAADPRLRPLASGGLDGHAHALGDVDTRMLLAHLAATAVAVLLLAVLERCALVVWAALHAVRTSSARVAVPALPRATRGAASAAPATGLVVVGRRPRRGPPVLLAPC